jgi:Flp pilus assembly protein protease CpaA
VPDGGCLAWALLPLRRYAEFGGRSRRTELVAFYLLIMLAGFLLTFAMLLLRSSGIVIVAGWFARAWRWPFAASMTAATAAGG